MLAKEFMNGLMAEFRQVAATETVVGEPLVLGDTTLIPVIRISIGVGAGGGEGEGTDPKESSQGKGTGVGGGGGVRVEPAAFIVLRGDDVQIHAAPGKGGRFAEMFEHLPDLVGKIAEARKGEKEEAAG
jgi:uncharacterized spore protein YtfJ